MGSYFCDDPDDLAITSELRAVADTKLVTVSPHQRPESTLSDVLLHEKADVAIDTDSAQGGGPFTVRGVSSPILPYARDIMLTVNQAIVAEFIEKHGPGRETAYPVLYGSLSYVQGDSGYHESSYR